jgi:tyrosine-protein kinase Etk/Wzc
MIEDKEKEIPTAGKNGDRDESSNGVRSIDVLFLMAKWRNRIIISTVAVMTLTAGVTLLMDKWYESVAVVLLPEKSGGTLDALMSGSAGSGLAGIGSSFLGGSSSNMTRYLAILHSRRLRENLINHYDLMQEYHVKKLDDALRILDRDLTAEVDKKLNTIVITYHFFGDAEKTAEMTNYVVSKLDEINRELATEQARFTRKFIEERYRQAKTDLQMSEDSLNAFQNKFGVISIPDQTKVSIEAAAKLQAQVVATETEYNVMKKTLGNNHPDLMRLESELQELRKAQGQMENGGIDLSVFIPFRNAPDLALQYFRLYRDAQINVKILEFLVPQYEQAKIQEARDTPTLLVLDKASPAERHYKPKKVMITLISGVIALFVITVFLFVREKYRSRILGQQNEKYLFIMRALMIDKLLK